jgi:hypothetical protein
MWFSRLQCRLWRTLDWWIARHRMLAQPCLQFLESQPASFVKANQEREGLDVVEVQPISVYFQKCCRPSHRDALVAVHERMILRQALPKCSRFLNDVGVITTLRSRPLQIRGRLDPGCQATLRIWRSIGRGRRSLRQGLDRRSLSQTTKQFWVLVDELVNRREKR